MDIELTVYHEIDLSCLSCSLSCSTLTVSGVFLWRPPASQPAVNRRVSRSVGQSVSQSDQEQNREVHQ